MEGEVSSKYHKSRRSIIKIGLGARKICRNVFKISIKKIKYSCSWEKKIKYLCSWEIRKKDKTLMLKAINTLFCVKKRKVIYLNTYETLDEKGIIEKRLLSTETYHSNIT